MVTGGDRGGVEDILKRIHAHSGVIATMIINDEGIPIRTSLDNATTVHHAALLHPLTMKAQSTVRDLDPENDLVLLRIRSEKQEIIVATENGYTLIAIQKTSE